MSLEKQTYEPIILTGYTGASKTSLLNKLDNGLDLEGIANHRGSSFGSHIKAQPSQIDFENNLAVPPILISFSVSFSIFSTSSLG